jgi:DNA gyrase subunit B
VTENAVKYTADDLTALEGLEAVRKRPGMYIGSTDGRGLTHCLWEIIDNSVDEAIAGFCSRIEITLHPDGSCEVADNGRGIPTDINKKSGLSGVALVLTSLHAGGKFGGSGYAVAGGLHGVGASVVNALSARMDVTVRRDGKIHTISFHRGAIGEFDGLGPKAKFTAGNDLKITGKAPAKSTGTTTRFWPDTAIFLPDAKIDPDAVRNRARQTAFLVPGLEIQVRDATSGAIIEETFRFTGGVVDMVDYLGTDKAVTDPIHITGEGSFKESVPVLDDQNHMTMANVDRVVDVDIALRWGTGYDTTVESFVNVVRTPYGGTHKKGFERGVAKALVDAIKSTRGLLKANEDAPTLDDVLEGLTAVVSVRVPEPQFIGQTKDELGTKAVQKIVEDLVARDIRAWVDGKKTKTQARVVLEKVVAAARVRLTQKAQKEAARRKTALEGASMPAKLADCRSTGVDRSELFIVEGDSALGTAKQARSSEYQALLPIRGKILNVHKASLADMLKNAECSAIIQVIGAGSGRTFDIDQARYGRIILMADADVDGSHIRVLLISLLSKYMRPLIEAGRVYAAMPPLFKIVTKGRNPETRYVYSVDERDRVVAEFEAAGKQVVTPIQRYKGLGEMDAEELWETTMSPSTRSVRQITIQDVAEMERVMDLALGSAVEPRRDWIIAASSAISKDDLDA